MPIDEDTKVFDVARPKQTHPDATSRPIIVGHQPQMSDPMVNSNPASPEHPTTPIQVSMPDEDSHSGPVPVNTPATSIPSIADENFENYTNSLPEPNHPSEHSGQTGTGSDNPPLEKHTELRDVSEHSNSGSNSENHGSQYMDHPSAPPPPMDRSPAEGQLAETSIIDTAGPIATPPMQMTAGSAPRGRGRKIFLWLIIILLVLAAAAYLAIDDGLIKSNIKLPFHIFNKQKTSSSSSSTNPAPAPPASPAPALKPAVPANLTAYTVTGTGITFDYPTAWGAPTATADPGFSKRGAAAKSDSTYAYLVNFAANKDVQMAFTSDKSLPAKRAPLYYDFLQWCVGTNDGKIYKQAMRVTTAGGVDTPANVVCDQGPLADAAKLDGQTIVQSKTKDPSGAALGDLYTENLSDATWVVMRVKDTSMTNGDNIKKLLATVKVSASSASSTTTSH